MIREVKIRGHQYQNPDQAPCFHHVSNHEDYKTISEQLRLKTHTYRTPLLPLKVASYTL